MSSDIGEYPCACGTIFKRPGHLARHRGSCLGPDPTLDDLHRVGDVVVGRGGCHHWRRKITEEGYGILPDTAGRQLGETRAHRAAWTLVHGPLGDDERLGHTCTYPGCINVDHLEVRDRAETMVRLMAAGGAGKRPATRLQRRACVICGVAFFVKPYRARETCTRGCQGALARRRGLANAAARL